MTAPTIKVYPSDLGGCGMYRTIWPGQFLAGEGEPVDVVMPDRDDQVQALWSDGLDGERQLIDIIAPEADVIVLQRPLQRTLAEGVRMLQRKGVRVVVEIDDDFDALSPRNVSWRNVQPHLHPDRNKQWLRMACEHADMVVVSTPALARRYGAHGRVRVVRNRVPAWYLDVERPQHDEVVVGWTGSIDTHPDDLQVTGGGVARAVKATGATFAVVGTGKGVRRALGLAEPPVVCGWVPIEDYPRAVAQFDIGIVPLELTPFNEAKSALKMMEYAALGVVPIVSPTSENIRMATAANGAGFLATNPRRWEGSVKSLAAEDSPLAVLAHTARAAMRAHTIEGNAHEWLDAWSSAVTARTGAHA